MCGIAGFTVPAHQSIVLIQHPGEGFAINAFTFCRAVGQRFAEPLRKVVVLTSC